MRTFVFISISLLSHAVSAQRDIFEYWYDGRVVLDTEDTIQSKIRYNLQGDVIQAYVNKKVETYAALHVLSFEFIDTKINRYRQFYSLPYSSISADKSPIFFELLTEGKLTVFSRELLEPIYLTDQFSEAPLRANRMRLVNNYYVLDTSGEIVNISKPAKVFRAGRDYNKKKSTKTIWLDLMEDRTNEIQNYATDYKLDFDKKYDLAKIVRYYNSLK